MHTSRLMIANFSGTYLWLKLNNSLNSHSCFSPLCPKRTLGEWGLCCLPTIDNYITGVLHDSGDIVHYRPRWMPLGSCADNQQHDLDPDLMISARGLLRMWLSSWGPNTEEIHSIEMHYRGEHVKRWILHQTNDLGIGFVETAPWWGTSEPCDREQCGQLNTTF